MPTSTDVRDLAVEGLRRALAMVRSGWVGAFAAVAADGTVYADLWDIPPGAEPEEVSATYAMWRAFGELDAGLMHSMEAQDVALVALSRFIGVDFATEEPSAWAD